MSLLSSQEAGSRCARPASFEPVCHATARRACGGRAVVRRVPAAKRRQTAAQYLSGGGDEYAALSFCSTLWLPHFGHTALASRSSMWHVTSKSVPQSLQVNS